MQTGPDMSLPKTYPVETYDPESGTTWTSYRLADRYELRPILLSLDPCPEAASWMGRCLTGLTVSEAVKACPFSSWLLFVIRWLPGTAAIEMTKEYVLFEEATFRPTSDQTHKQAYEAKQGVIRKFFDADRVARLERMLIKCADEHLEVEHVWVDEAKTVWVRHRVKQISRD